MQIFLPSSVIAFLSFRSIPAISLIVTFSYVIYVLDTFCYSFLSKCHIHENSKYLVIFYAICDKYILLLLFMYLTFYFRNYVFGCKNSSFRSIFIKYLGQINIFSRYFDYFKLIFNLSLIHI